MSKHFSGYISTISFEEAIAITESLLSDSDIDASQLQSEIANLVQTANGARGFFVCFLTGDWHLADQPSSVIIEALQTAPTMIAELLVKNLAMSTAMAIFHLRTSNLEQVQGSQRVAKRTALLIEKLNLDQIIEVAAKMAESAINQDGEYANFLKKWGYDAEQKQAIAAALSKV